MITYFFIISIFLLSILFLQFINMIIYIFSVIYLNNKIKKIKDNSNSKKEQKNKVGFQDGSEKENNN